MSVRTDVIKFTIFAFTLVESAADAPNPGSKDCADQPTYARNNKRPLAPSHTVPECGTRKSTHCAPGNGLLTGSRWH